jgi:hypothetical protein
MRQERYWGNKMAGEYDDLIAAANATPAKGEYDDLIAAAGNAPAPAQPAAWYDVPGKLAETSAETGNKIKREAELTAQGKQASGTGAAWSTAHLGSGLVKGLQDVVSPLFDNPVSKLIGEGLAFSGGDNPSTLAKDNPSLRDTTVQPTPEYLKKAAESFNQHPEWGNRLGSAFNVATSLPLGSGVKVAGEGLGDVAKGVLNPVVTENIADKAIQQGISKGIKPTVVGKKTLSNFEGFYDKANDAVKTIAENKNDINIVDENGEAVAHPRTAGEMAQAVDQAKKIIYKKYNDMAVAAGDAGAQFDVTPVMNKLTAITGDVDNGIPPDLKFNTQIRNYAENLKSEIGELHGQDPEVIEERIKDLNSSLTGFYEGRVGKAKAQVDASVAQLMREELDNNISGAVGEGYQGLKNQYGALKSIEKEVNHRAIVNARKSNKGLFDMTDIFTGGDLAAGILTANPVLIAKGAAGKGIMQIYKALNNPDRQIDKMFRTVYKLPMDENTLANTPSLGNLPTSGSPGAALLAGTSAAGLGALTGLAAMQGRNR